MIGRALPGILPPLTLAEALDVTHIYSVAGALPAAVPMSRERPFRAPHHTISHAGLMGDGKNPHPGGFVLPAQKYLPIAVFDHTMATGAARSIDPRRINP